MSRPKYPFPPLWLEDKILKEEKGSDAILITKTKTLTVSDVNQEQSRLMLPRELRKEFLTDEEKRTLQQVVAGTRPGISVDFFDPLWNKHELDLKEWPNSLALTGWKKVLVSYGGFAEGQVYIFCCFRSKTKKLCFCLVSDEEETYLSDEETNKKDEEEPYLQDNV